MFGQKTVNKEAIIAEYLSGGITYRHLAEKHGIDFRTINYWVLTSVLFPFTARLVNNNYYDLC